MPGYRLSNAAADDLTDIFLEGLATFGLPQADDYHTGLERTFRFLSAFPRAARLREEIAPPVRAHPYRSHLVVYEIDGEDILILRVRHGREDWS